MMYVIGKQPIEKVDFESAGDNGEHWRILVTESMVKKGQAFQVPIDVVTLNLIEKGILERVDPNAVLEQQDVTGTEYVESEMNVSMYEIQSRKKKIKVTVGLPLFRAKYIGWLVMESLCNQKNAPEWELIVCEEIDPKFQPYGKHRIKEYLNRLKDVNCQHVHYVSLSKWVPLSKKWQVMARNADGDILIMQAADCYAQPYRLKETYDLMKNGKADWCQSNLGYFYSIGCEKIYVYDGRKNNHPCALNMAFCTKLGRFLPSEDVTKSVDKWLYKSLEKIKGRSLKVKLNRSRNWKKGIDTHGLGNISMYREAGFKNCPIWKESNVQVDKILAMDMVFKLRLLKGFTRQDSDYRPWNKYKK